MKYLNYKNENYNIILFIAMIIFRISLDYIFINVVSPEYYYLGLTYKYSTFYYIISWIYIFLIFLLLNKNIKTVGSLIVEILVVCSAIPTSVIIAFICHNIEFIVLNFLYWFFLMFFYYCKFTNFRVNKIKVKNPNFILKLIFFLYIILILFSALKFTGIHLTLNLYEVYNVRADFKNSNLPLFLQYIFNSAVIVFTIYILYWYNNKNNLLLLLSIFGLLLTYLMSGRKASLFLLLIDIIIILTRKIINYKNISLGIIFLNLVGLLEYFLLNSNKFIDLFIRRLFILPAYLNYAYFDFFKDNAKDLFRQSIVGRVGFNSPYSNNIPSIIGKFYYGGSYANNGLFSDAYFNFGFLGIIILPLLISVALKALDKVSGELDIKYSLPIIIVASYTFLSSSFFTVMITHGYIIGCFVIFMISQSYKDKNYDTVKFIKYYYRRKI
ncbi:MAG: hypothetical protein E6705_03490 [Peptoniphilus harei]|uniref:hypothetical protein n=1 Tax=Peptoniphilus harei TaxID=54005 RepID=UPI0029003BAF|nr:hypothetical protein [Peptoniphilus harei]MDU3086954.1 hypothetical protein [Peptoniphilus harei]